MATRSEPCPLSEPLRAQLAALVTRLKRRCVFSVCARTCTRETFDGSSHEFQCLTQIVICCAPPLASELNGSYETAVATLIFLDKLANQTKDGTVQQLLDALKFTGKTLLAARPLELAVGNVVRRVLHMVREDCRASAQSASGGAASSADGAGGAAGTDSLLRILERAEEIDYAAKKADAEFMQAVGEMIKEILDEIRTLDSKVAAHSVEHIHAKELIFTAGYSKTLVAFFEHAQKTGRRFEVVVAEAAPSCSGQKMAEKLAALGIDVTLIADAAVFAMMARANKVIVGTHAVVANGGMIAHTGMLNIALAARAHSVPFVVVTGLYKLCPLYAFGQDTFNEANPPSQILAFEDEEIVEKVDIQNPAFDYVAPEHITLFVSNYGGHNPSYVYRLLAELYSQQDYEL